MLYYMVVQEIKCPLLYFMYKHEHASEANYWEEKTLTYIIKVIHSILHIAGYGFKISIM